MDNEKSYDHALKLWPQFFQEVVDGNKRHELRKNDRDFKVDDVLLLQEFDPDAETYTGRECKCHVTYVSQGGKFGLAEDYCILSIALDWPEDPIIQAICVTSLVGEFFGSEEKTTAFMFSENPLLGGMSPRSMLGTGRGEKLRRWIETALEENN